MRESGENYLETIYILLERIGEVRSIDVANELGFSKPSISRAVSILKNDGFITITDGLIRLTQQGRDKAIAVYNRHAVIKDFLTDVLQVDGSIAEADACRIEHVISEQSFTAMKEFNRQCREHEK